MFRKYHKTSLFRLVYIFLLDTNGILFATNLVTIKKLN